jgi:hypothetical protein
MTSERAPPGPEQTAQGLLGLDGGSPAGTTEGTVDLAGDLSERLRRAPRRGPQDVVTVGGAALVAPYELGVTVGVLRARPGASCYRQGPLPRERALRPEGRTLR